MHVTAIGPPPPTYSFPRHQAARGYCREAPPIGRFSAAAISLLNGGGGGAQPIVGGKRLPLAIAVSSACKSADAAAVVDAASVYEILPNTLTLPLLIRLGTQRRELTDGSDASRYPALPACLFIRERLSRPRGYVRAPFCLRLFLRLRPSGCVRSSRRAAVVFCVAG